FRRSEVTEVGDGFGCALGGQHEIGSAVVGLPGLRHRQQVGAKAIGMDELPLRAMQTPVPAKLPAAKLVERLLHRIKGFLRARENSELDKIVEVRSHAARAIPPQPAPLLPAPPAAPP